MFYLAKVKKSDLIPLGEEIDIDIPLNAKVISLVKESEDFNDEFVKCRLEIIQQKRTT